MKKTIGTHKVNLRNEITEIEHGEKQVEELKRQIHNRRMYAILLEKQIKLAEEFGLEEFDTETVEMECGLKSMQK